MFLAARKTGQAPSVRYRRESRIDGSNGQTTNSPDRSWAPAKPRSGFGQGDPTSAHMPCDAVKGAPQPTHMPLALVIAVLFAHVVQVGCDVPSSDVSLKQSRPLARMHLHQPVHP